MRNSIKIIPILGLLLLSGCASRYYHSFGYVPEKGKKDPAFTRKDSLTGALDKYRTCYDVNWYDINLDLRPADKSIKGSVSIHFTGVEPAGVFRFDLYENLKINSVTLDGKSVPIKREFNTVFVTPQAALVPGQKYVLEINYEGMPLVAKNPPWDGGFVWGRKDEKLTWAAVACEGEGASIWFPCKDHLADKADSARFSMKVPVGAAISNGILTDISEEPNGIRYVWETSYPITPYNITFYYGDYNISRDYTVVGSDTIVMNYFIRDESIKKAFLHFKQVEDVLYIYSKLFGPYPWMRENFKLVETLYAGMEHQTAIAYGNDFKMNYNLGGDYIIVHEAAHEWWGNSVSATDFSEIWLQESFATFAEILFCEYMLGQRASLEYIDMAVAPLIRNERPLIGPRDVRYWKNDDSDVYHKGAMMLHTMRVAIGDKDLFIDIIQTFYERHKYGHATTKDFISLVEEKTGSDWSDFFEVYLYSRKPPKLNWIVSQYVPSDDDEDFEPEPGKYPVNIDMYWSEVPEGFTMPVYLWAGGQGFSPVVGTELTSFTLMVNEGEWPPVIMNYFRAYFTSDGKIIYTDDKGKTKVEKVK